MKSKDDWLLDAEVHFEIKEVNSQWEVSLIFIDKHDIKNVIVHKMGLYKTKRLAEIYAFYMVQTASRDARGTQKVTQDAYDFSNN